MAVRKLIQLRRRQMHVADPGDNVTLHAILLRCCACGTRWPASLGESGDAVPDHEARCPTCTPAPPAAA